MAHSENPFPDIRIGRFAIESIEIAAIEYEVQEEIHLERVGERDSHNIYDRIRNTKVLATVQMIDGTLVTGVVHDYITTRPDFSPG